MIPNIGPMELAIVLVIAIVVLGPKRLPEMGSSLGRGMRNFKKGLGSEEGAEPEVLSQSTDEASRSSSSSAPTVTS